MLRLDYQNGRKIIANEKELIIQEKRTAKDIVFEALREYTEEEIEENSELERDLHLGLIDLIGLGTDLEIEFGMDLPEKYFMPGEKTRVGQLYEGIYTKSELEDMASYMDPTSFARAGYDARVIKR